MITAEEMNNRKAKWQARNNGYNSGNLWKYAQTVGSARYGATTHPGAKFETKPYNKI